MGIFEEIDNGTFYNGLWIINKHANAFRSLPRKGIIGKRIVLRRNVAVIRLNDISSNDAQILTLMQYFSNLKSIRINYGSENLPEFYKTFPKSNQPRVRYKIIKNPFTK